MAQRSEASRQKLELRIFDAKLRAFSLVNLLVTLPSGVKRRFARSNLRQLSLICRFRKNNWLILINVVKIRANRPVMESKLATLARHSSGGDDVLHRLGAVAQDAFGKK